MEIISTIMNDVNIVGLVDFEDTELMFEIEEAIRKELEYHQPDYMQDELMRCGENDGDVDSSFEYVDDDCIICPICK